jgi:hypothetical protein
LKLNKIFESQSLENILENHVDIANNIVKELADEKVLKHFEDYIKIGAYPFYFGHYV